MLKCCHKLLGYRIESPDGRLGRLSDFYFDDRSMRIIYGAVHMPRGLNRRRCLISTMLLETLDHRRGVISVDLSKTQVRDFPHFEQMPGLNYYPPALWETVSDLAVLGLPVIASPFDEPAVSNANDDEQYNQFRSVKKVCGYALWGPDGKLGQIRGCIISDKGWTMPYILIRADNESPARKILMIHTSCLGRISPRERRIDCDIPQKLLAACPYFATDPRELNRAS
jgi:hypothetical protein